MLNVLTKSIMSDQDSSLWHRFEGDELRYWMRHQLAQLYNHESYVSLCYVTVNYQLNS